MRGKVIMLQGTGSSVGKPMLARPCGMFPGLTHGHVRLCVRTEEENGRLVEALRTELGK